MLYKISGFMNSFKFLQIIDCELGQQLSRTQYLQSIHKDSYLNSTSFQTIIPMSNGIYQGLSARRLRINGASFETPVIGVYSFTQN